MDALCDLFAQHHWALMRTANGILGSREDAEDAVQNAYCNAVRTIHNFRHEAQLKTWMFRIVVNCCLAELRRRRSRRQLEVEAETRPIAWFQSDPITPEALYSEHETRTAHANAVSRLPRMLHEVYLPCAVHGVTVAEASRQLGLSEAACKTRLHRARRIVQEEIQSNARGRAA